MRASGVIRLGQFQSAIVVFVYDQIGLVDVDVGARTVVVLVERMDCELRHCGL
jgi:hypothetical protein